MNPEKDKENISRDRLFQSASAVLELGSSADQLLILEFLSVQSTLKEHEAARFFPSIQKCILHSDTRIRYFARKARARLLESHPAIEPQLSSISGMADTSNGQSNLSPSEVLLRKMHLGSRYMAFDAIERLTESCDPALATPLLEFLAQESDPYKISYLVKRLARLDDPRIPQAIAGYLGHADPRIVANALEGLAQTDSPQYCDCYKRLAMSEDNRIRGNAVYALSAFDPSEAARHLREMLLSENIALQDTAVYLLGKIKPQNMGELAEIALNSKFANVRLKALDLPADIHYRQKELISEFSERHIALDHANYMGLAVSFLAAALLSLRLLPLFDPVIMLIFISAAFFTILFFRRTNNFMHKAVVTIGLIACMNFGGNRLFLMPALIAVWIPWPESDKAPKEFVPILFAWLFIFGAIIISRFIQGDISNIMAFACGAVKAGNTDELLYALNSRQVGFEVLIFIAVAGASFFILRLNSLFPSDDSNPKSGNRRKFLIALLAGLFLVTALNLGYVLGIRVLLAASGHLNPAQILNRIINK